MATNYTTNYQLNQWEPTDQVLRTDFNADNAKVDAALGTLSEQAALMCRAVPDLAYYIGLLGVLTGRRHGCGFGSAETGPSSCISMGMRWNMSPPSAPGTRRGRSAGSGSISGAARGPGRSRSN